MTRVAIVGTGDCALGLCCFYRNHNWGAASTNSLVVTKPKLLVEKDQTFHDTGVPLAPFDVAIKQADVIILAIPAPALRIFVPEHYSRIKDKIVVDATNSSRRGEDLRELLCVTDVAWVKAFNDIGAIDGMTDKATTKGKPPAKMCSSNPQALSVVKEFAETSLGLDVRVVPYERYADIAMNQDSYGREWVIAGVYMGVSFILFQIYNILRHHVHKGYPWYSFPLFVTNKALAWTVLHGMTSAQIPGILAHFHAMWHKDTLVPKPHWLRVCLSVRKHVGLLSLWMLLMHIIGSCIFFNEAYLKKFFSDPKAYSSKLNWMGELSFACGVWGTGLYTIMGVASMPNVTAEMTSKQWWFIFGPIAWIALALGTVHTMVQGVQNWDNKAKWYGGYPQMTLTSTILPMFVFTLKAIQLFFWFIGCGQRPRPSPTLQYNDMHADKTEMFREDSTTPGPDESYIDDTSLVEENRLVIVGTGKPKQTSYSTVPMSPDDTARVATPTMVDVDGDSLSADGEDANKEKNWWERDTPELATNDSKESEESGGMQDLDV